MTYNERCAKMISAGYDPDNITWEEVCILEGWNPTGDPKKDEEARAKNGGKPAPMIQSHIPAKDNAIQAIKNQLSDLEYDYAHYHVGPSDYAEKKAALQTKLNGLK
jgi:hypothetical protein